MTNPKFDPKEADESMAGTEPAWMNEGQPEPEPEPQPTETEPKYALELFMSTDGKHTVHLTVDSPKDWQKAMMKAMEWYDFVVARYGTKQAQAVKEYGNGRPAVPAGPDQSTCPHTEIKFAQSHTEKNPGRWFKSCKACGKFMGWQ